MPSLLSPVAKEMGSTLGMVEVLSVDKVMWAYCPAEPAPLSNLRMWLPSNCVVRSTEPPAWPVETGITVSSKVKPLKVPSIFMGGFVMDESIGAGGVAFFRATGVRLSR